MGGKIYVPGSIQDSGRKSTRKSRHPGWIDRREALRSEPGGFKNGADRENPGIRAEIGRGNAWRAKSHIKNPRSHITRRASGGGTLDPPPDRGQEATSTGSASSTKAHPSVLQTYWTPCFLVTFSRRNLAPQSGHSRASGFFQSENLQSG